MTRALALPVDIGDDEPVTGRVYFILDSGANLVKIGYTTDLAKRFGDLQTGSSTPLSIILHVRAQRPIEIAIHRAMASERVRGEWFRMSEETTDLIDEIGDFLLRFEDEDVDGRDHILTVGELMSILSSSDYGETDG